MGPLWFIRAGRRCGVQVFDDDGDDDDDEGLDGVGRIASIAIVGCE
jgi:hypothetical protein